MLKIPIVAIQRRAYFYIQLTESLSVIAIASGHIGSELLIMTKNVNLSFKIFRCLSTTTTRTSWIRTVLQQPTFRQYLQVAAAIYHCSIHHQPCKRLQMLAGLLGIQLLLQLLISQTRPPQQIRTMLLCHQIEKILKK